MDDALAVSPDIGLVFPLSLGNLVEMIHHNGVVGGIREIYTVYHGDGELVHRILVLIDIGLVGGNDDSGPLLLLHRDGAPPIHRLHLCGAVDQAHPGKEEGDVVFQEEVHLEGIGPDAFKGVKPQHRGAVVEDIGGGENGGTGEGGMSADAAVPLHAAGEPGVPHGKVAGAKHRVVDDEVSLVYLVVKGPHAPAQGGDKGGLEKAVFQHGHVKDLLGLRAVIVVLTGVGQHVEDISVVNVQTLRLIQNAGLFKHFLLVEDGIGAVGP